MPPKSTPTSGSAARGRPPASKAKASTSATSKAPSKKNASAASKAKQRAAPSSDLDDNEVEKVDVDKQEEAEEEPPAIPPELLTRILHEFFEKDKDDGSAKTRITKDANEAVTRYMDIFVKEAIARTAVEKGSGFLEVEDLEKIAPQLLLDL